MKIRKAKKEDIPKISKLILNTLDKINSKDYKKRQLKIEKKCHWIRNLRKEFNDKNFFVLVNNQEIIGVIELNPKEKEIDRLFLKPNYLGKGFGKKLMGYVEGYAKKKGIKEITLYPTIYALDFYKKAGYKIKKEFIGTRNGGYPVIEMKKKLK
jgi:N-acetylglutamate synthase-like GNAT family acetyltransferase